MNRRFTLILHSLAFAALACTSFAAAAARKTFQDQCGADLIKVRATREMIDDLELAKKMIEAAKAADTAQNRWPSR